MENLDLNLENYGLNELLHLFNLTVSFGEPELKVCYKKVLMTHPDKSNLPKEYFLFFSKAFKIIKKIYDYKIKSTHSSRETCVNRTVYNNKEYTKEQDETQHKKFLSTFKNTKDFNNWFNKHFEKIRMYNPETDGGHGDWLKTEDDEKSNINSVSQMHKHITDQKEYQRSIIVKRTHDEMVINSGNSMKATNFYDPHQIHTTNKDYSSGFTDKFKFNDLKKAYEESVVPVTDEDYFSREKYNINELKQIHNQSIDPYNSQENNKILHKKQMSIEKQQTHQAYMFAREMDEISNTQKQWKSYLYKLTNG